MFLKPGIQALFPSQVYASNKDPCVTKTLSYVKSQAVCADSYAVPALMSCHPCWGGGLMMWVCLS